MSSMDAQGHNQSLTSNGDMENMNLVELASLISSDAGQLAEALRSRGLSQPSTKADAPLYDFMPNTEPGLQDLRNRLVSSANLLSVISMGTKNYVMDHLLSSMHSAMALNVVHAYHIAQNVPLDGAISFAALSKACGLEEDKLTRVVRFVMYNHFFSEPTPGQVSHSAASKLLATDAESLSFLGHCFADIWLGDLRQVDALRSRPGGTDPTDCGTCLAISDNKNDRRSLFDLYREQPARLKQFATAMAFTNGQGTYYASDALFAEVRELLQSSKKFVDVGGSWGHTAIALLQHDPTLQAVVQDLPEVIEEAKKKSLPPTVADRLDFQAANFFEPQPVKDADVYLYRFIFHDWPREKCIEILRNLVPSMPSGSRLVVNEIVLLPPIKGNAFSTRFSRLVDMQMMVALNAKERSLEEWQELVVAAVPGSLHLESARAAVIVFKKV